MPRGFLLTLNAPQRAKKNSADRGLSVTLQYRRFERAVVECVGELRHVALSLPDAAENLRAMFYIDKASERTDLFGLPQMAEALETANAVTGDWRFRRCDGDEIVFDKAWPRVVVAMEPP